MTGDSINRQQNIIQHMMKDKQAQDASDVLSQQAQTVRLAAGKSEEQCMVHLQLDKALTHSVCSFVNAAQGSSEASHADLYLAAQVGVAAQRGEEILGRGGDL